MSEEFDPSSPLFFLSYAHADKAFKNSGRPNDPNRHVITFFDDLSENVAQLVSRPTGSDPGFIDRAIAPGRHWTDDLLWAMVPGKVMVALFWEPYFASRWCAMEWDAFSRREVAFSSESPLSRSHAIIPVIWAAPMPENNVPQVVGKFQRFTPTGLPDAAINAQYQLEGIVGLLEMGINDAYRQVTWKLAQ